MTLEEVGRSRRHFVLGVGSIVGGLSLGLSPSSLATTKQQQLERVGIQLYTVRDHMSQNVPKTLNTIANIGYQEVEFAGYYNHSPAAIKAMLVDAGLRSPSSHVGLTQLRDSLDATLDALAEIGHEYVVLAYLTPAERQSLDAYKSYIELFSRVGEAAKNRGLQFGFHNHDFEFAPLDGVIPYDLLLSEIDPEHMKMTMDLYWIHRAGADPLDYFRRFPGRFKQCHVKDMDGAGNMVEVGAGKIDFATIFSHRQQAGFEHYYVEHDQPQDSLVSAQASLSYLQNLSF